MIRGSLLTAEVTAKERSLWLLHQLVPDCGVSNVPLAFGVGGRLRWWPLQAAITQLVRRHEVLRTVYRDEDGVLSRHFLTPDEAVVDLRIIETTADRLDADLTSFAAGAFEPDGTLLVRAALFLCPAGDVFCLVAHHLVFDGKSVPLVTAELVELVEAASAELPPPDRASTEAPAHGEPSREGLDYWRDKLAGTSAGDTALSIGREPLVTSDLRGGRVLYGLGAEAHAAVSELRVALRATDNVVLLAAFYALLVRHGAGPDVVVGCPIDVRPPGAGDAVGYLINTVALRQPVTPETTFAELVRQVRVTFLEAMSHADVPIDAVLAEIPRQAANWKSTLFRHMFNFMDVGERGSGPLDRIGAHGIDVHNGFSRFDFEFFVQRGRQDTVIRALYGSDVVDAGEIEALLQRYEALIVAAAAAPDSPVGDLDLFGAHDQQVIAAANDTATGGELTTVPALIARQARQRPDAVAIVSSTASVTYGMLWQAACATAQRLREHGIGHGDLVAVVAERGVDLAAAVLGVHLCRAAYLPLDPDHPPRRFAQVLGQSGAAVVLGDSSRLDDRRDALAGVTVLPLGRCADDHGEVEEPEVLPAPDDVAYVIYTSGSTGTPKGVRVGHGALANVVVHFGRTLDVGTDTTTAWQTTFGFDISALELFLPLAHGAPLVAVNDDERADGAALFDLVEKWDVRVLQATPTSWHQVLGDVRGRLAGRVVLCGGEPLSPVLARRLAATGARVLNVYGPTETTIWSTCAELDGQRTDDVHVGTPIANTTVFVVDEAGRELPVGLVGELCIAGSGVAQGYHRAEELTASKFGTHALHGHFYRTGDLARWDRSGRIRLVGRIDRQVKVRGNRIELDEIESVLGEHPEVSAAVVLLERAGEPDARIVAVVQAEDREGLVAELWRHARSGLSPAAVPQEFRVVARLQITPNGKLDRTAAQEQTPDEVREEPLDERLAYLVDVWARVLGSSAVHADTNFFLHGGHSLLGVSLLRSLGDRLDVRLRLTELFSHPSPREMAARLDALGVTQTSSSGGIDD
jgi:amino acid adenylation domain-containing protein